MGGTFWSQDVPTSLDGAAELISLMNTPAPAEAIPAYSGPSPGTVVPRDEKRRPMIMNQEWEFIAFLSCSSMYVYRTC